MVVQLDAAKAGEIRDRQRITAEKDEATFEVSKLKAHLVGLQKELEAQVRLRVVGGVLRVCAYDLLFCSALQLVRLRMFA